jgi:hypothetical protein
MGQDMAPRTSPGAVKMPRPIQGSTKRYVGSFSRACGLVSTAWGQRAGMQLQQVLTDRYNTSSVSYLDVCRARDDHVETRPYP